MDKSEWKAGESGRPSSGESQLSLPPGVWSMQALDGLDEAPTPGRTLCTADKHTQNNEMPGRSVANQLTCKMNHRAERGPSPGSPGRHRTWALVPRRRPQPGPLCHSAQTSLGDSEVLVARDLRPRLLPHRLHAGQSVPHTRPETL